MTPAPDPSRASPRVFKFGGTSVADAERIGHVAALVAGEPGPVVVVVSALAGTTDLLGAFDEALRHGADGERELDRLQARHLDVADGLLPGADDGRRDGSQAPHTSGAHDSNDSHDSLGATGATRAHAAPGSPGAHVAPVVARLRHAATRALPELARGDAIRAAGEDLSAPLVAHAIAAAGRPARVVDARTVVRTDAAFGAAVPDEDAIRALAEVHLAPLLADGIVPVVQGFVGATADGRTTTLGRGGSDYTATLLGAALDADEVHIWTDVDGVLTGDPRAVEEPRILEVLGFEEAVELAYFGAKVLHPGAAKHAVARGLSVRIRNTFAPERPGTLIARERWGSPGIAAVAFKPGIALIQVRSHPQAMPYGFLARVFEVLARHRLPVDLVATSHTATAFTLDATAETSEVADELGAFAEVEVHLGQATITVVGRGLLEEPGISARVFEAVAHTPVQLISQATDVGLSLVVSEADAPALVRTLHATLIGERALAP